MNVNNAIALVTGANRGINVCGNQQHSSCLFRCSIRLT
jgi:hypothetical protein